ncbi:MAG: alpha-glucan family phosphorylase [Phycisphaerae bacterium]|nr:alpha-glucan family phosphorylase [Phycisphaerae bacterium]MDD5380848.1 alpha-glucan family phosphorylase [Phycisphaerae bacterium]
MPKVCSFTVLPALPDALKALEGIARNLFWCWNTDFIELFKRIDGDLWAASGRNPVKLLASLPQRRINELAQNQAFLSEMRRVEEKLKSYLDGPTWFEKNYSRSAKPVIAYFCAEFGIHECLPFYSGGLGLLAGDHLKSASDLGIPLVGVGLLYQKGYFRQYLDVEGWQQETYSESDFYSMPIELVRDSSGQPLTISVEFPDRAVHAQIWSVSVGRVKLYLLDTNIQANSSTDRMITSSLYGGDVEMRIRQEIVLGIGGSRALAAMDIKPAICHMNEGHAAFMVLERIRHLRSETNMTFAEAVEATKAGNVFTIHTLVKAGLDEFSVELIDKYFANFFPALGISREQFLSLGRILPDDAGESFKMPILALRLSSFVNGVSKLHGQVSREVWSSLWPAVPVSEVPIISITNGVHTKSWLSDEMSSLYGRYLGPNWTDEIVNNTVWDGIDQIPEEEFWRVHQQCKGQLIAFTRNCLKAQVKRRGTYHSELNWAEEVLDVEALTIGFARRFVNYKRGNLLLRDPERFVRLLNNPDRPVQIIFAGKAHPRDTGGKEIVRQIINFASKYDVQRRIVFLEDYDINVARMLVRGVDVWLNNPRRPMEACGTSGMKAAINGALNMSTLDGWWCEGYRPDGGWAIGAEQTYSNSDYQDEVEARAVYDLLENEVIPLFYTRSADDLPRAWISRVKNSVKWIAPRFNTHRMVAEYTQRFYNPAAAKWRYLTAEAMARAKVLSTWKSNMKKAWPEFAIKDVQIQVYNNGDGGKQLDIRQPQLKVGSKLSISALVKLPKVSPDDVSVELYHGPVDSHGSIRNGSIVRMAYKETTDRDSEHWFVGSMSCGETGQHGVAVRVLPRHADLVNPYELGLVLWETTDDTNVK